MKGSWLMRGLVGCILGGLCALPGSARAGEEKTLYTFEKGTDGWWTYASPDAKVTLSNEQPGAGGSQGALKIAFAYGKGGSYLGVGIQPQFALGGTNSLAAYAGGHLALDIKSAGSNKVKIEIRTADKKSFSFQTPATTATWGKYQIPFAEFKNKDGAFDPATMPVNQIVIIPLKGSGETQEVSIDNVTLSSTAVELKTDATTFSLSGQVLCEGKPVPGAKVALGPVLGISFVAEATTGADGRYSLTHALEARRFVVTPAEACPTEAQYDGALQVEKEGYAPLYQQAAVKAGAGKADFTLRAVKTLPELKVQGNRLVDPAGKEVWLQGVCIDSLEWSATGDFMLRSTSVAILDWKSNCVRIPVKDDFWFGKTQYQKDGGEGYRSLVDKIIRLAAANGAYTALDLHRFGAPMPEHVEFWKDAAARYKNNPAVLFDVFNEPHGISWEVWKNGGSLKVKHQENAVVENNEKVKGDHTPGMQALVDAVRSTGAKNIVIAGGLSWSYDLSGVVNGFALEEREGGNGIMYSHHNYPWKKGWQKAVLDAAEKYPIFIGEVGNIRSWEDFKFIGANERYEDLSKNEWAPDMLGMIQKYRLNWTAFSFHPKCGPQMIQDWDYTPTPYWGAYAKEALAGKQFTLNRLR